MLMKCNNEIALAASVTVHTLANAFGIYTKSNDLKDNRSFYCTQIYSNLTCVHVLRLD